MKQPSIADAFSKPKPPSKTTSKKLSSLNTSDSEAETKAPVTKPKTTTKRKQANSDDSDSDSGDLMARIRAKTTAGSKVSLRLNSVLGLSLILSFIHSHYGVNVELNICPNLVENQEVVG